MSMPTNANQGNKKAEEILKERREAKVPGPGQYAVRYGFDSTEPKLKTKVSAAFGGHERGKFLEYQQKKQEKTQVEEPADLPLLPKIDLTKPNYRKAGVTLKKDAKKSEQYMRAKERQEEQERKNWDLQ